MFRSRLMSAHSVAPFLLLAALLPGCPAERDAAEARIPRVMWDRAVALDVEERIDASGQLLAVERAEIAAEIEGRVTSLLQDEGEEVTAGAVLLLIDPEQRELQLTDARAHAAEAAAALRDVRHDHERVLKLHERGAVSGAQLDSAEASLAAATARLESARARVGVAERALRDAAVVAPFSGWVSRRFVSRGEYVRRGESLFELVSLDPIEVELFLPEADASRVRLGLSVEVQVTPYPAEVFDAKVTMVSPTIDSSTRTLRLKARLDNPGGKLRPGLFARADLGVAVRRAVPMIPEEAILQRADGPVVFCLSPGNAVERRVIETGVHRAGQVEVVSGIAAGDQVVVRGHSSLVDGIHVAPQEIHGRSPSAPLAQASKLSNEMAE